MMKASNSPPRSRISRSWRFLVFLLAALCGSPVMLDAQRGRRDFVPEIERIDPAEGERRIAEFRQMRLAGDYAFDFVLEHMPRRGAEITYRGKMYGSWSGGGTATRIRLEGGPEGKPIVMLVQSGPEPGVWVREGSGKVRELGPEELFEPIVPGLLYSPFDLQMPFLYWRDYDYTGPARVVGRPAQEFLMSPPATVRAERPELDAIRMALDDSFNVLLKADMLNAKGKRLQSFQIREFKKLGEQAIIKSIDLIDWTTRDKTRFRVTAAAMDMNLDETLFTPEGLVRPVDRIPSSAYEFL